jgi:protein-disulfide isomerase
MQVYENLQADLEVAVLNTLVADEAKARNIDTGSFIAAEITDKLRTFTEDERAVIEGDLMRRLFTKYNVKILLPRPAPIVHNVSVDDDPQTGSATAPVTIVMFTDFQCPACSGTHPVLKRAIEGYGDKVRFVVRDYPLENIHPDAFNAALAANAARAQGKFNEYAEILYRNQQALDKPSLVKYAEELGLNVKQFELDFSDARTASEVKKDQADGRGYGIGGTPAIFVNGIKVHRLSLNGFRSAIDRALAK